MDMLQTWSGKFYTIDNSYLSLHITQKGRGFIEICDIGGRRSIFME
jgi:hypothetical protein